MVTFSSHSGNIWCGQPEDTTSVEKPRSRIPDGNPQMVSTNDTGRDLTQYHYCWERTFKWCAATFRLKNKSRADCRCHTARWFLARLPSSYPFVHYPTVLRGASNLSMSAWWHQFMQPIKSWVNTRFFSKYIQNLSKSHIGVSDRASKY